MRLFEPLLVALSRRRVAAQDGLKLRGELQMAGPKPPSFETLSLHAGQHPDPVTGARAVPIYQTTSYVFQDADHAAALFNLERAGHIYTRISNPTIAVLEERLAALEGGVGAVCTASGMAAMHLAIATLLSAGDHIVASASLYGGTINLLAHTLPRFGIETTFVKPRDHEGMKKAIRPNTRLMIGETIGNPGLEVLDIPKVSEIAHAAKIPLLIDNTFATPFLSRPAEQGADIIMHSITKWIGGHGVAIGGVLVDGGRFDFQKSGKFPTITEPYDGYHGIRLLRGVRAGGVHYTRAHGRAARFRRVPVADQCLLSAARRGDVAAAHGAACGEHRGGARFSGEASGGRVGAASDARHASGL
jgi:O-acetylhomoserine/O-acetylserine sulfhydrylase-like pyridoxal-dependent enzyme